jgi:glycerol-3-phosphate acyltransferase PlsX
MSDGKSDLMSVSQAGQEGCIMRIIVDAMGGDNAPGEIVKGCLDALRMAEGFEIELIGDSARISQLIEGQGYRRDRLVITHATEIITNDDKPTEAIRRKTDSSLVVGLRKIRDKCGHAFISAGSTGALLAGSLLIPGRIKGVNRPALAPVLPSACGGTMLIDAGMNTALRPVNYVQFGIMGAAYMREVHGVKKPRVGLVNVGTEEGKGNSIVQEAFTLLQQSGLHFVGNIEGRDIAGGKVDVAVCDGFTGNAMLKMMEGTGRYFLDHMKMMYSRNIFTMLAAAIVRKDLGVLRKKVDPEELGGTPILGIDGIVFKCHGNAKAKGITNTILKICNGAALTVTEQIRMAFNSTDTAETIETGGNA